MRVVLWSKLAGAEIAARLRENPGVDLVVTDTMQELVAALPEAEILAMPTATYDADFAGALRERAKRLRFIQLVSAGYEGPQVYGVPSGVPVANAGDSWSPAVAEHAMALLLALTKCIPQALANQARRGWDRSFTAKMGTLDGGTLCIVGYGSIGREAAKRARAFGMRVIGVSRRARPDPLADEVAPVAELRSVLPRADAILLAVPYSPESEGLFGEAEFAACKPGALLVNIARGGLIDSRALAAALASGKLGGAGLDVTDPEPLPGDDPLWDSPNLIVTPHLAGACGARGRLRLAAFVGENIGRFISGDPVTHVVIR